MTLPVTKFWIMRKSGELERRDTKPKSRSYVQEYVTRGREAMSETLHVFTSDAGRQTTLRAGCGYDRGPRREAMVRRLFETA